MVNSLQVLAGAPERAALVLSVPHGGCFVPAEFQKGLTIHPLDLWSDWYTDELYDFGNELEIPTVVAGLSRFVADPNREPTNPLHGSFWSTVVPATDPWDVPLYERPLDNLELTARIAAAHRTYHDALDRLVETSLEHHSRVLLLDLHSFGLPLDADIIIGDREGTSADPGTSATVAEAFTRAGFRVERNTRFAGGHITARRLEDARVDAVQIELNQRRYLAAADVDEARPRPARDDASWHRTRDALRSALQHLAHSRTPAAVPHPPGPETASGGGPPAQQHFLSGARVSRCQGLASAAFQGAGFQVAAEQDSIVGRAQRVHHSLEGTDDPRLVQVAVGGPCPACGERVEITMHSDSSGFTCDSCGGTFAIGE